MSNLTPLVPEKTYAICTNGLKKGKMVVTSHKTVRTKDRRLIATEEDKPTNFACVYAGILAALIGGAIVALTVTGVGATLAGLLIVALASVIAAYGLGGVICWYCLKDAKWSIFHTHVLIEKKKALIATSTIVCNVPLPFSTPGFITLVYSLKLANKLALIYRSKNLFRIFDGVFAGYGIIRFGQTILGNFAGATLVKLSSLALPVLKTGGMLVSSWIGGILMENGQDFAAKKIGNSIVRRDKKMNEFSENITNEKYNQVYETQQTDTIGEDIFLDTINGEDFFAVREDYKVATSGKAIENTYQNSINTEQQRYQTTKADIEKTYGTEESIRRENNSVAKTGPEGVPAKAAEYRKQGMSRSEAMKKAWADYKAENEKYIQEQMDKKQKAHTDNKNLNKKNLSKVEAERQTALRNQVKAKTELSVLGFSILSGVLGKVISNCITNDYINSLDEYVESEDMAMKKLGIYEEHV